MLKIDIINRINELIKLRKLNKSELADDLKISRNTLYSYLDGNTEMTLPVFLQICDKLDLQVNIGGLDPFDKTMSVFKKELVIYVDQAIKAGTLK